MRSKIIIRLGPKITLPLNLSFLDIPKGKLGVFTLVDKLSLIISLILILGVLTWELLGQSAGGSLTTIIYGFVIILFFLYVLKVALAKNQLIDQIAFDIPLLIFTTFIALSLFMGTAIFKNSTNIWGGSSLRMLTGVSIIAYWFLYYLLNTNLLKRKLIQKSLLAFWLAPLYALLVWLVTFSDLLPDQQVVLGLMLPASIWLVLTQSKHVWLHVINVIISLVVLITFADRTVIAINIMIFTISMLVIVIKNKNNLVKLFTQLDKLPEAKNQWMTYIQQNSTVIYLMVSALAFAIGVFWAVNKLTNVVFDPLLLGFYSLQFNDITSLLLGNGLTTISASTMLRFIHIYGLIPTLALVGCGVVIIREMLKTYKVASTQSIKGIIVWLLTSALAGFLYLLLAGAYIETLIITLLVQLLFFGLIKQFVDNKTISTRKVEMVDFTSIKNIRNRDYLKILQICFIILVFFAAYYLLSSLNYINIFLVTN